MSVRTLTTRGSILLVLGFIGLLLAVLTSPTGAAPTAGTGAEKPSITEETFIEVEHWQCEDIPVEYKRARRWAPPPEPKPSQEQLAQAQPSAVPQGALAKLSDGDMQAPATAAEPERAVAAAPAEVKAEARKDTASMASGAVGKKMAPSATPPKSMASGAGKAAAPAKSAMAKAKSSGRARETSEDRHGAGAAAAETFPDAPTVKYLSADDSNSQASPTIARRLIRTRRYVAPELIRTYEFLNYYSFPYAAPKEGELAIVAELRPAGKPGEYSMQVAVRSRDRDRGQMRPLNLTLLVDASGSMAGSSQALANKFVNRLVAALRPGEMLSLVVFNRNATTLLSGEVVSTGTAAKVAELLAKLQVTDITNLEAGVKAAYAVAAQTYSAERSNRVVVVSDGAANAGKTAKALIAKHAEDADRQGIYLAGIGVGEGFDDSLMDALTDKGRGAYVFLDDEREIDHLLQDRQFVSTFDLAVKDVRLKLTLPPHWKVREFHGEQMSSVKSDVVPQYLAPNDQMLYHLVLATSDAPEKLGEAGFELEAEYTALGGSAGTKAVKASAAEMLASRVGLLKGDAVVRYAEALKRVRYPLEPNRDANLKELDAAFAYILELQNQLHDVELASVLGLLKLYRRTLDEGEGGRFACDKELVSPPVVLGINPKAVRKVVVKGPRPKEAIKALTRLLNSDRLLPLEGYRFLALGSGPVGSPNPDSTGELSNDQFSDPIPRFSGAKRTRGNSGQPVFDLHQIVLELTAPTSARSFSFDFNYFSAEYPDFVHQDFNDTFYAILEAASTNQGKSTNISFDPNRNSIEVDNNYFQNTFHPIPNDGTGFERHGSTGWLRTSWPIKGGENFSLTFSIHDEGDGILDSVAILDNFRFHDEEAVGNTDPLN